MTHHDDDMSQQKTEFRFDGPNDLAQALDAIALSYGIPRTAYILRVLSREVNAVAHRAMVLQRCAVGNPRLSAPKPPIEDLEGIE